MTRVLRTAVSLTIVIAAVVVWAFTLRPQALGGPAVFVAIRGSSMLPTYEHGDLVVVEAAASYRVGDVAAYRVPAGQVGAGKIVVHRVIGGDARHGFVLRGDNNTAPDPWMPKQRDMVGVATVRIANAGRLVALVRQPVILAGLAAGVVVALILAQPPGPPQGRRPRRRLVARQTSGDRQSGIP